MKKERKTGLETKVDDLLESILRIYDLKIKSLNDRVNAGNELTAQDITSMSSITNACMKIKRELQDNKPDTQDTGLLNEPANYVPTKRRD